MTLLLAFFLLSIGFSFLCSILEAVILSITPNYINRLKGQGSSIADDLEAFKKDIDKPLSAILTLNTIAHTVGAIGVGAQAGNVFGNSDIDLGIFTISAESVIATLMTLAILVLSEIIPKTIGANKWESLAPFTVRVLKILVVALMPFVWLSQRITKTLKKEKEKSVLSRTDFTALTEEGVRSGAIDKSESRIIGNLLQLDQLQARDIMTPRSVMMIADKNLTVEEYFNSKKTLVFSRIPIYNEKTDHMIGFVLKDNILEELARGNKETRLEDLKLDLFFVEADTDITKVLHLLLEKNMQFAIVRDKYGSITGLLTLEDIFETLLGMEIVDEMDTVEDMQKLARELWQKRYDRINK
ncbi:MAG: CNNM domain-containing protein [Cyclobacteriaceae bacterium]